MTKKEKVIDSDEWENINFVPRVLTSGMTFHSSSADFYLRKSQIETLGSFCHSWFEGPMS